MDNLSSVSDNDDCDEVKICDVSRSVPCISGSGVTYNYSDTNLPPISSYSIPSYSRPLNIDVNSLSSMTPLPSGIENSPVSFLDIDPIFLSSLSPPGAIVLRRILSTALRFGQISSTITSVQLKTIRDTVIDAYATVDQIFGLERAVKWAASSSGEPWNWPVGICDQDTEDLIKCDFDLSKLVRQRQDQLRPHRLNQDRVSVWAIVDPDDPDIFRLRSLADHILIPLDPDFVPSMDEPPHAKGYRIAHSAVNKIWYDLQQSGLVLLLATEAVRKAPPSCMANSSPCMISRVSSARSKVDRLRTTLSLTAMVPR